MNLFERFLLGAFGITYVSNAEAEENEKAIAELKAMTDAELDDIDVKRSDIRNRVMGVDNV